MKSFKKIRFLLFGFILAVAFGFINTNVFAKTVTPDEIQGPAYVIGSHVFTREVNETTGYEGKLTTNLIMLASQTIGASDLDSMIIYYKTASGIWINGLNGLTIEPPSSFELNYTDLQEDENSTVSKPKAPILHLDGPLAIDNKTDMMSYQLNIYAIDEESNKVDGVELTLVDNNNHSTSTDIILNSYVTVQSSYTGDILEIGKSYHHAWENFESKPDGFYSISARTYVEDANGNRVYSDLVNINITPNTAFPSVEIIDNYSNQNYVAADGNSYVYKLGIKKPEAYVFKINPSRFAYVVREVITDTYTKEVGIYGLDEEFIVTVPDNTVKTYYAQLGYYDADGKFNYFNVSGAEKKHFIIDRRKLTTPILYYNVAYDYVGAQSTPESIARGEYIYINDEFYEKQEENSLDYQIEGVEIYRVYYTSGTSLDPGDKIVYELVEDRTVGTYVFPPDGQGFYTARVYATNKEGKRVYSDFSDRVGVVRTPLISASEVVDGKVTVTVENIDEYFDNIRFTLYAYVDSKYQEIELASKNYDYNNGVVFEIDVTENMEIYADASIHDWVHSTDEENVRAYSYKSNGIDIVVE